MDRAEVSQAQVNRARKAPKPLMPENTRLIGFIRPDHSRRVAWILLGAIPTLIGALLVGYAYGRIEVADPAGIHLSESEFSDLPIHHPSSPLALSGSTETNVAGAWLWFALGMVLIVSGPGFAIIVLRSAWKRDEWILLRNDALVFQDDSGDLTLPWYEMTRVHFNPEIGEVQCTKRDGDIMWVIPARYTGRDPEDTARRLDNIRRKSSWGLLG